MSINLPNTISFSRLLAVPFLLYSLHDRTPTSQWICLGVFLVAAGTDWLDGYLARKLNQVTELGKFLDPLVDKLLVLAPLLVFIEWNDLPAWGVFLILARELTIAGWRVNSSLSGAIAGANFWGKLKTVSQIVAIALLMIPTDFWNSIGAVRIRNPLCGIAFWISVGLTLISGLIYLWPHLWPQKNPSTSSVN